MNLSNATKLLRLAVFGLLASASLLLPETALADPQRAPLDLEWVVPDGCPPASSIVDDVTRITGGAGGASRHVTARARVEPTAGGAWRATIDMRIEETSEVRTFEAESCAAVADAATLILAIAVNPLVLLRPLPPPERPAPSPPRPPPPVPPPARVLAVPPVATSRFALGASLVTDAGSLPQVGVGAEGTVAWTPGRFRVEAAGSGWFPREAVSSAHPNAGARFQMFGFGARLAYAVPLGPLVGGPVLGASAKHLAAEGFGGTARLKQSALWFAPFAGAMLGLPLHPRFSLRFSMGVEVPTVRPSFVVLDTDTGRRLPLHEVAPVTGRVSLGFDVHLL